MKIVQFISWKEKRELLWELIKQISDLNGGDDPQFLKEYYEDVLKSYKYDINKAIDCFKDIRAQLN